MMLRIGNESRGRGFTLIEVMVTVAILSLATVLIYHSFFISFEASLYAANRLNAQIWLDNTINEEIENSIAAQTLTPIQDNGVFVVEARDFKWQKSVQMLDAHLCALTLAVSWNEAGKRRMLTYATFLSL